MAPPSLVPDASLRAITGLLATAVIGQLFTGSYSGSALELQSIISAGRSQCAGEHLQLISNHSIGIVQPLIMPAPGDASAPLGSGILALILVLVHSLSAIGFGFIPKLFVDPKLSPYENARCRAMFPSLSFVALALMSHGLLLDSCKIIFSPGTSFSSIEYVFAALCFGTVVVFLALPVLWLRREIHKLPFLPQCAPLEYRWFLPHRYWKLTPAVRRSYSLFGWLDGPKFWMIATLPIFRAVMVSIAVAAPPNCTLERWLLLGIFLGYALLIAVLRPYRSPIELGFAILFNAMNALISAGGLAPDAIGAVTADLLIALGSLSLVNLIMTWVTIALEVKSADMQDPLLLKEVTGQEVGKSIPPSPLGEPLLVPLQADFEMVPHQPATNNERSSPPRYRRSSPRRGHPLLVATGPYPLDPPILHRKYEGNEASTTRDASYLEGMQTPPRTPSATRTATSSPMRRRAVDVNPFRAKLIPPNLLFTDADDGVDYAPNPLLKKSMLSLDDLGDEEYKLKTYLSRFEEE